MNRRQRQALRAIRPLLDALAVVVFAATVLVSLYWSEMRNVILPLAGAALVVYLWVTRWRTPVSHPGPAIGEPAPTSDRGGLHNCAEATVQAERDKQVAIEEALAEHRTALEHLHAVHSRRIQSAQAWFDAVKQ